MIDSVKIIEAGTIENWIGGRRLSALATKTIDLVSPYTSEKIGECPLGRKEDLDRAVSVALEAFQGWKNTHIKSRVQVMFRMKMLLEHNIDELANLAAMESGKLIEEGRAGVLKGIEILEYACSLPNLNSGDYQEVSNGIIVVVPESHWG